MTRSLKVPFQFRETGVTIRRTLTFDDVLLVPCASEVLPSQASTRTHFARDLYLNAPLISAAMDTVTESEVATRMAQTGGLGFVHKNLSIAAQVRECQKVKRHESGMIRDPLTLRPDQRVADARKLMDEASISGFPVTRDGKLVGILTNRDLRFETNLDARVDQVMTRDNLVTAERGTTLDEAKAILHRHRIEKLPVVEKDRRLVGMITITDIKKSEAFPDATKDSHGRLMVGAAVGASKDEDRERTRALIEDGHVDIIVVDTAHGHARSVLEMTAWVHKTFPQTVLVAGNVVTAEATVALYKAGADVVKVGIGSGSICTTRIVAGVGVPQVSAVMDCAEIARGYGRTIIADGGMRFSGDVVKALAAGSNAVMLGNLLAGSDETPGETVLYQGRTYKVYRGMGSTDAMAQGSRGRYFQDEIKPPDKLVPEGIVGRVPYKGAITALLHQTLGGLRAGMGYLGAMDIVSLQRRATFVEITGSGRAESHVHDVAITKEAPNYRLES